MDGLRQYIFTIIIAAMICGIVSGLTENTTSKALIRLLCGLFLAITILRPITDFPFQQLDIMNIAYMEAAKDASLHGKKMMRVGITDIIKEKTEAYIWDKAVSLNVTLDVAVEVNDENLPEHVVLSGDISPYARQLLETYLESDLGISKENQKWTG